MNTLDIYNSDMEKTLARRVTLYRLLLLGLALILLLGLILFYRNVDPIEPGRLPLLVALFTILGGWIGLFILFHGLNPGLRALRHVRRMREEEGEERQYRGPVCRSEKATPIPGSIPVYRVELPEDEGEGTALLWEKAAAGFPREGRVFLKVRKGYISGWKEAGHE